MSSTKKKTAKRSASKKRVMGGVDRYEPKIGEAICIRTVTHYHVGIYAGTSVVAEHVFLALNQAAWVADTGRFAEFLRTGVAMEVEPFNGPCLVGPGAIVDIAPWRHALLEVVK